MNNNELEQHWDARRDRELTDVQRQAFDEHMVADEQAASLWNAETRWLSDLHRKETPPQVPGEASFTEQVLERFDREPCRGVIGRIGLRSAANVAGWGAAAAALAMIMWVTQPEPAGSPRMVHSVQTVQQPTRDAVTVLVDDVTEQMRMRPAHLYNAVRDTQSMFTMERAFEFIGMDVSKSMDQ
jgi:hypothetical protein